MLVHRHLIALIERTVGIVGTNISRLGKIDGVCTVKEEVFVAVQSLY